ncbi:CHASE2 domain-containing protein [Nostoc sp. CENA67]|uniref:CHASE2 domain-containing protein n=1 Tax=Amazonocrinis nigriterrae CENA67 TaxID=2794033 RepID=A0A8J7HV18_9NOST|nr:CHASE2 domain-containing protein [Amazonocrinis nigriterrae]MBH8566322.1 CHASE2 domain-containing protein [Amazonocrinis nigriterrae CENA67]
MVGDSSKPHNLLSSLLSVGSTVIVTSLAITGIIMGLRTLGSLEGLELAAFDQLIRMRPDEGPDNRFLIVGINDVDIQTRKEYPIQDGTLAKVLAKLEEHEPRVIGVDILRDVPQGAAAGRAELVKRLSQGDRIVAACVVSKADSPGIAAAPGIPEDRVGVADFPVDAGGIVRQGMVITIPQASKLPAANQHICNYANAENQLPSLSFQMAVRYLEAKGIEAKLTKSGEIQFNSTVIKRLSPNASGYRNANTGDYQILLNYRSAKNVAKQVSISDILADKVDPALIKDKIVMIGYTAPIVKDDFYTPYSGAAQDSQKMPGVAVHVQNASQILSAVLDQRSLFWYWDQWQENVWIFAWSLVGGFLAWRIRKPWLLILGTGVAIAGLFGSAYIIFLQAGWIPLIPPALGLLITAVGVVLIDRYAATIVKTVKGFLKINIEIDEAKKDAEVAAIAESDYFLELQQKAKDLRNRDNKEVSPTATTPIVTDNLESNNLSLQEVIDIPKTSQPIAEIDYLQQVRDRRNQLNLQQNNTDTNNLETSQTQTTVEDQEEIEYLQQLQRRGKKLRETEK